MRSVLAGISIHVLVSQIVVIYCINREQSKDFIDPSPVKQALTRSPSPRAASDLPLTLLVILSPPDALHERTAIRETWSELAGSCNVKLIFPFAGKFQLKEKQNNIRQEHKNHEDVIMFEELKDDYYSDLKLLASALKWVLEHYPSAQYIGRASDDVWINFPKLISKLKNHSGNKEFILGHFVDSTTPDIWEVVEDMYILPDPSNAYALPGLWITPRENVVDLLDSMVRFAQPKRSGDMVLTGYGRNHLGLRAYHIDDYVNSWDILDLDCSSSGLSVIHGVYSEQKSVLSKLDCFQKQECLA